MVRRSRLHQARFTQAFMRSMMRLLHSMHSGNGSDPCTHLVIREQRKEIRLNTSSLNFRTSTRRAEVWVVESSQWGKRCRQLAANLWQTLCAVVGKLRLLLYLVGRKRPGQ